MPTRPGSESQTLTRLFQARSEWDRLLQVSNLLKEAHIDLPDFFESSLGTTICREPNNEKLAWRLAREIHRRNNGKIPAALQPYLDRPDFEQEERAQEADSFRKELLDWLSDGGQETSGHPRRELRVVWKIEPGYDPFEARVQIDLRVNSPKLKEGSRNFFQVRGLCNEAANRPELFTAEDQVFLRWLSDFLPLLLTDKNRSSSPFLHDNRSLLTWLTQWGTSGRCHWDGGGPVEFSPLHARIVPQIHSGGEPANGRGAASRLDLGFEVVTAAGLREPITNARLFLAKGNDQSRPELELVCVKQCFYRLTERPPRSLMALALKRGVNQVDVAAGQLLPPLLRRYPHLQQQVKIHLRQVPSQVKFYFHLDEDDALQIRLAAHAREGKLHWEWADDGWSKSGPIPAEYANGHDNACIPIASPGTAAEEAASFAGSGHQPHDVEIWADIPADADTAAAVAWLKGFEGERGELCGHPDNSGWWLMLQPTRMPALLQHWKDRSASWQYFVNRRFQQLISGKRRRFPKLKIRSTGIDWFSVQAEWEDGTMTMTEEDWGRLQQTDDPYVKLSNGAWLEREEAAAMAEAMTALAEIGVQVGAGEQQIGAWQMSGAQQAAWKKLETLAEGENDAVIRQLRQAVADFKGLPEIDEPKGLRAELRPYQKTGLHFLAYASRFRLGALLADDMGLGKTVQALAWLQHLRETAGPAPSLVICPASVVFNWRREAQQFTPGAKVLLLTAGEHRHSLRQEIPQHDLVVTNYALLRRDLSALQKFSFRAIILDEAQNIKNPESMVARAAKALRANHKLALTGTPLENRLLDLWSIMEFVHPGYLPERSKFYEQYDRGASQPSRALLSSRMRPIMLRRLKKQVAQDLPDRIEERLDCELTEGQRKFYLAELQRSRQTLSTIDLPVGQSRMHILAALTRLRQICCHPSLAGGKRNLGSGKTAALFDVLEPLYAGGHKVLVFSQFVEMLKLLKIELEERGRPYYMLTGQTTQRAEVVQAFHNCKEPAVFLLSLKAAGTGLNLTSASYVVLYDPWWNPAVEAQAIDRTHRIGQDRTVIAYRLVTRGTVEEKIWRLQQSKAQLAQDVLGEEGFTGSLTRQDFDFLLEDTSEELTASADAA
ncbi:MAG TPA: DEAD/DEAH box helicase [Candidatus Methylacidiphilales bacterium]|nr:DEAD/DEAH box helicase [Candidatus Methylacidiphilales bacterium]